MTDKVLGCFRRMVSPLILPMMTSSMQPIAASKAASAAEELEGEKQMVKIRSFNKVDF